MTVFSVLMLRRRINLRWAAIGRAVLPSLLITGLTVLPIVAVLGIMDAEQVWAIALLGGSSAVLAWLAGIFLVRHPLRLEIRLAAEFIGRKLRLLPGI